MSEKSSLSSVDVQVVAHHPLTLTDAMKNIIHEKCEKLTKYFHNRQGLHITLSKENYEFVATADLHLPKNKHISATIKSKEMYETIDRLIKNLAHQITQHKEKIKLPAPLIEEENVI